MSTGRPHGGSTSEHRSRSPKDGAMSQHQQTQGNRNSPGGVSLVLNVCPLTFTDKDVIVGTIPYRDHDQLRELRCTHGQTHVFRRRKRPAEPASEPLETSGDGTEIVA